MQGMCLARLQDVESCREVLSCIGFIVIMQLVYLRGLARTFLPGDLNPRTTGLLDGSSVSPRSAAGTEPISS